MTINVSTKEGKITVRNSCVKLLNIAGMKVTLYVVMFRGRTDLSLDINCALPWWIPTSYQICVLIFTMRHFTLHVMHVVQCNSIYIIPGPDMCVHW